MVLVIGMVLRYIICFSFISAVLTDTDKCERKGPCSCEFANGTGFDLSPSAGAGFFTSSFYSAELNEKLKTANYTLTTHFFHPCYDMNLNLTTTASSTCGTSLSLCRHVVTLKQTVNTNTFVHGEQYDYLGSINNTAFSNDGKSITYFNTPSSTVVMLVCAQTPDILHVYSVEDPNAVVLAFYSQNACLKQIEDISHRSFGSTLLIIFFSCAIFYLVLGILTKKFLMGATGIEVIPNLAFWTELPGLCKDGWAFIRNGFKVLPHDQPSTSHDPKSYDSI